MEALGDRRPGEHARLGDGDVPAGAAEAFDQHVAALLVERAVVLDDVLRAVERGHRRRLDRREGAIIEIGFHPGERLDQPALPTAKPMRQPAIE